MEEPCVILVSSDGATFELPRKIAYLSSTIQDIFEAKPGKRHVPIPFRSEEIQGRKKMDEFTMRADIYEFLWRRESQRWMRFRWSSYQVSPTFLLFHYFAY